MATKIAMRVIPKPVEGEGDKLGLAPTAGATGTVVMDGVDGPLTFVCGECSAPLATNISAAHLFNKFVKCSACGSYNEPGGA